MAISPSILWRSFLNSRAAACSGVMSISPGSRLLPSLRTTGQTMPGIRRAGRRLTYWSNSRRNRMSEPHSEMWSGTFSGQPTAPK